MKALTLSALLFSSAAFAEPKDLPKEEIEPPLTQEEREEQGMWYWAQKPLSCSSGIEMTRTMASQNEAPRVWMDGLVGMPNGTMTNSKFVIAVNPKANPTTWTLIEFTDRGSQGCVLGWGVGNINIAITQDQPQGTKVDYSVYAVSYTHLTLPTTPYV